jgi:hypothetical protein
VLCWIALALMVPGAVLRIAFPEELQDQALYALLGAAGFMLVPVVGALIASRLPANPYGWLWCALGLDYGVLALSDGLSRTDVVPSWIAGTVGAIGFVLAVCLIVFVLLLFPTGRLPGRIWRVPAGVAVVLTAAAIVVVPFVPSVVEGADSTPWAATGRLGKLLGDVLDIVLGMIFGLVVLAAGSVLVRFRRAEHVERQQLKWFLLAAGLLAADVALDLLGVPVPDALYAVIDGVTFALLPVAVGIAMLRYRLYEIDRIVSRTVSYGLLTGGLVALYLVVVAVLRPLLEPVTGSSALAVAASTLAVAAVFNPARRRLQAAVDRRFDRARYDADRAVDAFAARLRNQVDLDEVTAGLRDTVVTTVAPTRVAVWLRAPSGTGRS